MASEPLRIVVMISGGGTTLRNLIDKIRAGELDVEIVLVISSNPDARGLQYAAEAGIPSQVVERKSFPDRATFSETIFALCRAVNPQVVVMGGFLKRVDIPPDFVNRVVNIHPSLIPKYCGHGFYGHHVHEAVLKGGDKFSGCTVHFVDDEYDHGPIILQRRVPVVEGDTPETLAARVFEAECEAYPEALRMIARGELQRR